MRRLSWIYQNEHGRWGWACTICPRLDRFGSKQDGRVARGGYETQGDAIRGFEKHSEEPRHQVRLAEERELDDYVTRVLRVFSIEEK